MVINNLKIHKIPIGFAIAYLLMAIYLLRTYFLLDFNTVIALVLAPIICTLQVGKQSLRYLLPVIIIAIIAVICPVKTLLFLAILFAVLLLIENFWGKINNVVFFLWILISPIFKYFSNAIGFPIRLWLSQAATNILNILGFNSIASGNIISINHFDFAVDQACAGLNMLATSLIICLFLIAFYQKRENKNLSFWQCLGLISLTILLNIISNLLRIILLIILKIMPENAFHTVVGVICMLSYVVLPLIYSVKIVVKHYAKSNISKTRQSVDFKVNYTFIHLSLLPVLLFICFKIKTEVNNGTPVNIFKIKDGKKMVLDNGVTKIQNKHILIYLKPTPFYAAEHNPMICWKGSGYDFKSIKTETISGKQIYTSVLVKGNEKIYSAWWFQSNNIQTINQLLWRWQAFKTNQQFYIVNVNAGDFKTLIKTTKKIINRDYSI